MAGMDSAHDGLEEREVFTGSISQGFRVVIQSIKDLGERHDKRFDKMEKDSANQWRALREQDQKCAARQLETERRMANGKEEKQAPPLPQQPPQAFGIKTLVMVMLGVGLVLGGVAFAIGFLVIKYKGLM